MSVQKYRGYFLYEILYDNKSKGQVKSHNFRKAEAENVMAWKRQFSNPQRYLFHGYKLNREPDENI